MKPKKPSLPNRVENTQGSNNNRIGSPGKAGKLLKTVAAGEKETTYRKVHKNIAVKGTLERLLKSGRSSSPS